MQKKILNIIIFLSCYICSSQKIRGFGGLELIKNTSFDRSGFAKIDIGFEYKLGNLVIPELEFGYFLGALQNQTFENDSGKEIGFVVRTVNAYNLNLISKINFGDEDEMVHFQILPLYNITCITAQGALFNLDKNKNQFIKTETDNVKQTEHSFGIGIGVLFDINNDTFQSIALNLNYNNIELGDALSQLKFTNNPIIQTNQNLSIGIKYYFGFKKKKTK
jgi:hypothetical protein